MRFLPNKSLTIPGLRAHPQLAVHRTQIRIKFYFARGWHISSPKDFMGCEKKDGSEIRRTTGIQIHSDRISEATTLSPFIQCSVNPAATKFRFHEASRYRGCDESKMSRTKSKRTVWPGLPRLNRSRFRSLGCSLARSTPWLFDSLNYERSVGSNATPFRSRAKISKSNNGWIMVRRRSCRDPTASVPISLGPP